MHRIVQEVIVSQKTSRRLLECFSLHAHFVFMIIKPRYGQEDLVRREGCSGCDNSDASWQPLDVHDYFKDDWEP